MRAAILAVGSELLGTQRVDTNSLRLTAILERYGVELVRKAVVGDREEELARELGLLTGGYDLVITSGGLGPTRDDLTREAVAAACGLELNLDEPLVAGIEAKFRSFGRTMPEVNRRQGMVIRGSEVLENRQGTAPGLRLEHGGTTFFLLPGVPRELDDLVARHLEPWLAERAGGLSRETRTLKAAMIPESEVEERVAPLYDEIHRERITILSSPGEVRIQLTARGEKEERRRELDRLARRVRELVGSPVFTEDPEETLAAVVGRLLRERGATLATAESCTGGMVAEWVTAVPGSSDYFLGSLVVYSDDAKRSLAGVREEDLESRGAVSEAVARSLARGARRALGADYGIGVTGVAGPGGGTEAKPVGLVHLAVVAPGGAETHRRVQFPGDRERVRKLTAQMALEMVRRELSNRPDGRLESRVPSLESRADREPNG